MADHTIRTLLFNPPVAVARLGGSTTPMVSFTWGPGDPRTNTGTRIRPDWTLEVVTNDEVAVRMPASIVFRDGALLRPVAPFLELWAVTGDGRVKPVTPALLKANGIAESDVSFTVTAVNGKAAHRTREPSLRFGTFPSVKVQGDDHAAKPLHGTSPAGVADPLIPAGRSIPLGSVQVLRPQAQPADPPFPREIHLDVLRLRFTPAAGLCYGPPAAAPAAVPDERAFLNPDPRWFDVAPSAVVAPASTVNTRPNGNSLGVVDDTCDAVITATLTVADQTLTARANVMVGPPHFAPDRRPFLSVADELNDRQDDDATITRRDTELTLDQRGAWVADLFERIAENVSLFDLDHWRQERAANLPDEALATDQIVGDGVPDPTRAMGGRDALRTPGVPIGARSKNQPFPLSARARELHRTLSDLGALTDWVLSHDQRRLEALVRSRLPTPTGDGSTFTMQMPPFMGSTESRPLALTNWQYQLLMAWKDAVLAAGAAAVDHGAGGLSSAAAARRRRVLDELAGDQP